MFADEWFFNGGVVPFQTNIEDVEAKLEKIWHRDLFALKPDVDRPYKNLEKHLSKLRSSEFLRGEELRLQLNHDSVRDQFFIPFTKMLTHDSFGHSEGVQIFF